MLDRRLASSETLGATIVICSDKTGTRTKGGMTIRKIYINDKMIDVTGLAMNLWKKSMALDVASSARRFWIL